MMGIEQSFKIFPKISDHKTTRLGNFPVGGRLTHFQEIWSSLGNSRLITNIVKSGYHLPFRSMPPLSKVPLITSGYSDPEKRSALRAEILKLVQKGAIEPVRDQSSPGYYSRLFLVRKSNGDWRPVIDLSSLNKHLDIQHFRMETPESIRAALRKGEWAASIDLSDAYLHIPVSKNHRKYLRFLFEGVVYQFLVTPFGLATVPQLFTQLGKEVKDIAAQLSIVMHAYLDDILTRAHSDQQSGGDTELLVHLLLALGFVINVTKSELIPTQDICFVGYRYLLDRAVVLPTEERVHKIVSQASQLVDSHQTTAAQLSALLGLLAATEKMVPYGRLHTRPLQWALKSHWRHPQSLKVVVPLTEWCRQVLRWWTQPANITKTIALHKPTHQIEVFTDASIIGWGAHCLERTAQGRWSDRQQMWHINCLEMETVLLALKSFKTLVQGRVTLVATDNSTVLAHITKQGGTHSWQLLNQTWELLEWCRANNVAIQARHIAGKRNILADALSRTHQALSTEWSLDQTVFNQIVQMWHMPMIDLFATAQNKKLPSYVSPVPDPNAWGVDALR